MEKHIVTKSEIFNANDVLTNKTSIQDEGLDHRDVDLNHQEPWDQIRDAVSSVQSSSRLVHLRHPSKKVTLVQKLILIKSSKCTYPSQTYISCFKTILQFKFTLQNARSMRVGFYDVINQKQVNFNV